MAVTDKLNDIYRRVVTSRSGNVKYLVVITLFMVFASVGAVLFQTFQEYHRAYDKARGEVQRLATIVSDQTNQSLQSADLLLQHAVERQHMNLLFGGKLPEDIIHNFKLWVDSTPQVAAMMLLNEEGQVVVGVNNKRYSQWIDYSAQLDAFLPFVALKEEEANAQVIMPYRLEQDGSRQTLLVARRLNKLDGTFGGIVVAAINPTFFLDYFASIEEGDALYMDIVTDNGKSIFGSMRHPRLWQGGDRLWQAVQQRNTSPGGKDSLIFKSDEHTKVLAYQPLRDMGLGVIISVNESAFLRQFWDDRFQDLSFLLLILVFGAIGTFFIVTMAKQIVRVEKSESAAILASQAKSEFLANMSHELRTPLNAIIGFSEMMTAGYFGPLNNKQKERMGDITLCGNHLLHLINDILEFSKGEAGRLEVIEEKVSIQSTVDEALRIMNEKIKSKGVKVIVDIRDDLPLLFADKRKLKQVCINLISNAVKFTPAEGIVSVRAYLDQQGNMVIEVTDTGIGIAEDDIATALAVFGQVHRSQSHEGTGLGLPLCRMFTELHGGKLSLSSVLGEGTTVRLQFPETRIIIDGGGY